MINDTDEQPDEDIHRERSTGIASIGASVPMEVAYITLKVCRCIHPPGNSLNFILLEVCEGCLM